MDELRLSEGPVLVLAPHPDDESLGCGRLLSGLWAGGRTARVVCLTDGAASHPNSRSHPPARLSALRKEEMRNATAILGGHRDDLHFLDLPDAGLHRLGEPDDALSARIADHLEEIGATILIAPSPLDPHCDHETAAEAARRLAACRPGLDLFFYPIWSRWVSTGPFAPVPDGARALIWKQGDMTRKRAAIDAHASQQGHVVQDDPTGFTMPPGFADFFADAPEIYFETRP